MKLLSLMKKEFLRFFRDPRLIITMILPGIIIFIIYSVMGDFVNAEINVETYSYQVYLSGSSQVTSIIETVIKESGSEIEWLAAEDEETAISAVESGDATAYLVFSENFDESVSRPSVAIYFVDDFSEGYSFYQIADSVLRTVGMRFDVAAYPVAGDSAIGMQVMEGILPFLIVIFIFSACMSVTLESVAGEKERGTLATILVTPVSRAQIALGKILPLSCISMIGATSSFLGVALSMPKLMGVSAGIFGGYSFASYLFIFLLIVSVVPLIVAAISAVSTWSKSVKEASGYTSMLMILAMVVSLLTAFLPAFGEWVVVVPVINMVTVMQQILGGAMPVWQTFAAVGANILYTTLLVLLIAKMFSSEKIMFGK